MAKYLLSPPNPNTVEGTPGNLTEIGGGGQGVGDAGISSQDVLTTAAPPTDGGQIVYSVDGGSNAVAIGPFYATGATVGTIIFDNTSLEAGDTFIYDADSQTMIPVTVPVSGVVYAAAYGMSPSASAATNSAALTAAIAAAQAQNEGSTYAATVRLPLGLLQMGDTPINADVFPPVMIRGEGSESTVLNFTGDAGQGNPGLTVGTSSNPGCTSGGFTVNGPGTYVTGLLGQLPTIGNGGAPVYMTGVKMNGGTLEDVFVRGCAIGVDAVNDHCHLVNVHANGNYINLRLSTTGDIANNSYERCDFTYPTLASIAFGKATGLEADALLDTHVGFGPFGIMQYNDSATSAPLMIASTSLTALAIEDCGNAFLYSEDNSGVVTGNVWNSCTSTGLNPSFRCTTYLSPVTLTGSTAARSTYFIDVGNFSSNRSLGVGDAFSQTGTTGNINAPNGFFNNWLEGVNPTALVTNYLSPATPVSNSDGPTNVIWYQGQKFVWEEAGGTITAAKIVCNGGAGGGYFSVETYPHGGTGTGGGPLIPIGVAMNNATAGQAVLIAKRGACVAITGDANWTSYGSGTPVKVSPITDGDMTTVTTSTDTVIGLSRNGNNIELLIG